MLQSILLPIDHRSMELFPHTFGDQAPIPAQLQLEGCKKGLAVGQPPFQFPKARGCGHPLCQAQSPWFVCSKLLWSCGMSALNSLLSF